MQPVVYDTDAEEERPDTTPWDSIWKMPPCTPWVVKVKMPMVTKPMCATDE